MLPFIKKSHLRYDVSKLRELELWSFFFCKTEYANEFPADWNTAIIHKYVMKKKNENI